MKLSLVLSAGVALAILGCELGRQVDCGPMESQACEQRVLEIESQIASEYPGRLITQIEILNLEGHAQITLDDGTEIGFGERL
jgi:hypothetical protein